MPPPVFRAAFSFVLQANPPRPAFRSRPEGAEYTGRGSLPCAGRVAEVSRGSGYEYFCTQNSSLCTFFRPWIPFSARKSVSSLHENSKVEMLERIQYALFILLFVLAGSLDGAQVQSGRAVSQPDQIRQSSLRTPVPAHNCFTAAVFTCDASIENPVQPSAQKAIVRLRHDTRAVATACGLSCRPAYSGCFDLHPKPVDYYVFSLGRILI